MTIDNPHFHSFICSFDLPTLMNTPAFYQAQNPVYIDQFLTNYKALIFSKTFETGLFDHHKLISTDENSGTLSYKKSFHTRKHVGHTKLLFQKLSVLT